MLFMYFQCLRRVFFRLAICLGFFKYIFICSHFWYFHSSRIPLCFHLLTIYVLHSLILRDHYTALLMDRVILLEYSSDSIIFYGERGLRRVPPTSSEQRNFRPNPRTTRFLVASWALASQLLLSTTFWFQNWRSAATSECRLTLLYSFGRTRSSC